MSIANYIKTGALKLVMNIAANPVSKKKLDVEVRMFEDGTSSLMFTVYSEHGFVLSTPHVLVAAETYDSIN